MEMTEQEVAERLKALPYDVPEDIKPAYIPPMMEMNGIEGKEAEEEFWEKLHLLSPEKQQEFFHAAREAQGAGKSMALIIVGMIGFAVLTWFLGGC